MTQRQAYPSLVLRAQGLACGRGGLPLADDMSFAVHGGTCLLLRGPNGTGKTTLLLTLAGIVAPLGGFFALEGADPEAGPLLHYCGHRNAVKPRLSVEENLGFWAGVNGATGERIDDALDRVGLGELATLDAGYLSAGQSRRLALARLLVTRRPLWLLDEPTAALDTEGHQLVTELIDEHLNAGGIAIAATHDPITLPDPARMETLALGKAA
ncbi:cytochrome c biogenesis ATP-binding export protein CcmA [Devosia yakushimensis]|uniref:Cytochrome c biogenesis ATP-binding export protein CcmA n=1 Tax=Devosia yakushimensis TaxID=470028 RepID=A0ABQ5UK41_9HYPH|nr:heme ABC exporter ATP-binding protein CcmA [Devosia yakushimensis]GLQ12200.1 cytochrome c biogenesis ATP-binding export protein CcmA [Devosia yakushimensis]